MEKTTLKTWQKWLLLVVSFFLVAYGQPARNEFLSLLVSLGGGACFWRVLLDIANTKKRFFLAVGWFAAVQCVQLSWFLAHPFLYIYGVILFCALLMAVQWGIIAIWIKPQVIKYVSGIFALAGLWTLLEWSRLFILSGLPFNPVGLTLSGGLLSLQFAALGGIYGLSFWVILTNLFFLRSWIEPTVLNWVWACLIALFPYGFGWGHLYYHDQFANQNDRASHIVLVQTALPIEESIPFRSAEEFREFVVDEWRQIMMTLKKQMGKIIDIIVFPEYVVPFGTHHHVYPLQDIQRLFCDIFGDVLQFFPSHENVSIDLFWMNGEKTWLVSNAYIAQTLANIFHAHVVIGLEESHYIEKHKAQAFSSCFHFIPQSNQLPQRYDKQVLVPMGEYIPFEWCKKMAAKYGVSGSFTPGQSAVIFKGPVPFGASICYEELYGNLMRENRLQGAELLINLTNDGWYPHSLLPKQHFDHARLRTVENGIPLVRACNTGVTGAIDSLGRIIGTIGKCPIASQEIADSILLNVPSYHYHTLYTEYGDFTVVALSLLSIGFGWKRLRTCPKTWSV